MRIELEPFVPPHLGEVAKLTGVPLASLSGLLQRGLIRSTNPKPRSGPHRLTAPQTLEILIHLALRTNTASAKLTTERAHDAMMKAMPVLLAVVRGQERELGYYIFGADLNGNDEERHFADTFDDMNACVVDMVARDKMPTVVRMSPLLKQLMAVMSATSTVNEVVEAAARAELPPATASANPPPESGLYRTTKGADVSGILAGAAGLEILHRGQGLGFKLKPEHWRELARRAEAIADEMEGRPTAPDAVTTAAWSLAAEAAGSA